MSPFKKNKTNQNSVFPDSLIEYFCLETMPRGRCTVFYVSTWHFSPILPASWNRSAGERRGLDRCGRRSPRPSFLGPSGLPEVVVCRAGEGGACDWWQEKRRDRPRLGATAASLPEVPPFFPPPSLSPGGWRAAPEVISPSPARGKHGGGLVHGAAIFRYF